MKRQFYYVKGARKWNYLLSKFFKTKKRIEALEQKGEGNSSLIKILVGKLKKLYHKLEQLQNQVGVKLAGTALALMLVATTATAQEFVYKGVVRGNLIEDGLNFVPEFSNIYSGTTSLYVGTANGYILRHDIKMDSLIPYKVDTVKSGSVPIQVYNYSAPAFGDIDNDGDIDLIVGDGDGYINVYKMPGFVNSGKLQADGSDIHVSILAKPTFADIDGDGDKDLYIGDFFGSINVFTNNGDGTFSANGILQADGNDIEIAYAADPTFADIDGDGDLDLFVGDYYGQISVFTNNAGVFSSQGLLQADGQEITLDGYASPVFLDIDNDGDLDLFVGNVMGDVFFYENDGTGTFTSKGQMRGIDLTDDTYSHILNAKANAESATDGATTATTQASLAEGYKNEALDAKSDAVVAQGITEEYRDEY